MTGAIATRRCAGWTYGTRMDSRVELPPAGRPAQPPVATRERVEVLNGVVEVEDGRVTVSDALGASLDLPISEMRRVQFDIETDRPGTLAFVPSNSRYAPIVLAVAPVTYTAVARVMVHIGAHLASDEETAPA